MSTNNRDTKVFQDTWLQLINTIKAANNLVPGVVAATLILTLFVTSVFASQVGIIMAITLLFILIASVGVYSRAGNFGEASLALTAGLLGVFAVSWTSATGIAFFVSWVGFSLATLIVSSVNIAAKSEQTYMDAAISIAPLHAKEVAAQLTAIAKSHPITSLSPIKRAEVIRLFVFRKLPVSDIKFALDAVEKLAAITRIDHLDLANFVADLYRMFNPTQELEYAAVIEKVYGIIRLSPVPPSEFIKAFSQSRRIVLSGTLKPDDYFQELTAALDEGLLPEEIYEHMRDNQE